MRFPIILPLLIVAANARPQQTISTPDWKGIDEASETERLRVDNQETRTYKTTSNTALRDSVKVMANQLTETNTSAGFTMDTRTPPKIKLQHKFVEKKKPEPVENSHPGVAVPLDVDTFFESTTQKRAVINRNENKPSTTDSGISTWILLSGQSTTSKPHRKPPTIKTTTAQPTTSTNKSVTEKTVKPTIKIKPVTTRKPKTTTPVPTTTTTVTETTVTDAKTTEKNRLMTKIKASVLNNAVNNKNKTTTPVTISPPTTISVVTTTTITKKKTNESDETVKLNQTISENVDVNDLQPEAKIGSLDLSGDKTDATTKRPKRPTNNNNNNKRKKNNKNRRRKPAATASEKIDNGINNTKLALKEKPFGTQIYNYLSREVMPTVGVGLVGLVVTAGLASYFFYPFGGLRRTFDQATDRKDYYYDEYAAGGVAEEELIGKVIAGMPEQHDYSNSYRTPLARKDAYKNEVNYNYRNADSYYQYPQNDYQTVSVGSKIGYGRDVVAEHQKESGYTVDDTELEQQQFVVGNVPKEFDQPVTPVVVPEHGPRSMRIRRYAQNDKDNEIIDYNKQNIEHPTDIHTEQTVLKQKPTSVTNNNSQQSTTTTTPPVETATMPESEKPNFFSFVRNLIELKVKYGLDFLLKTSDSFSRYIRGVQERVNHVLREEKGTSSFR